MAKNTGIGYKRLANGRTGVYNPAISGPLRCASGSGWSKQQGNSTPPAWLLDLIDVWADSKRLALGEWTIHVSTPQVIKDKPNVFGYCTTYPTIREAYLDFRSDIQNDEYGRRTVIHELLHVYMADIDEFVENVVLEQLDSKQAKALGEAAYSKLLEPFITKLANILYHGTKAIDYPDVDGVNEDDHD